MESQRKIGSKINPTYFLHVGKSTSQKKMPSRELKYATNGKGNSSYQRETWMGYVSSQERVDPM